MDEAQRLREIVLDSLDQEQDANGFARHAYRSRTQFYRVFRALIEETPIAMRRRLLLERAAWQLSRTQLSVTDISLDANYGSLEAFTRAFRNAFGVSPSLYRRMGATCTHLRAANGIHHRSGKDDTKGAGRFMDLFDIFSGQESWHTRRLLDLAKTLKDELLDRPLNNQIHVFPWDGPDRSLRQLLDRMVQTKEAWAAALTGGGTPLFDNAPPKDRTPSAMLAGREKAEAIQGNAAGNWCWRAVLAPVESEGSPRLFLAPERNVVQRPRVCARRPLAGFRFLYGRTDYSKLQPSGSRVAGRAGSRCQTTTDHKTIRGHFWCCLDAGRVLPDILH